MEESLKISWQISKEDFSQVNYFINAVKVGENDEGFEKILQAMKKDPAAAVVIKINPMHGLGGEKLEDQLPFKKRYNEFIKALGKRKLIYEIF